IFEHLRPKTRVDAFSRGETTACPYHGAGGPSHHIERGSHHGAESVPALIEHVLDLGGKASSMELELLLAYQQQLSKARMFALPTPQCSIQRCPQRAFFVELGR